MPICFFMAKYIDLIGMRFSKLIVLHRHEECKGVMWVCKCDCGGTVITSTGHLKSGHTQSCGCHRIFVLINSSITHGMAKKNSEYSIWEGMKKRCSNPNCKSYSGYGAKNVKVCDRWLGEDGFSNFYNDMGPKPTETHSLDRYPNKKGNYEPSNCRWATPLQQAGNKTNNTWIEYNGMNMILADWSRFFKLKRPSVLDNYLKRHTFKQAYDRYTSVYRKAIICPDV